MQMLDASGAPIQGGIPKVLTATFCRSVFFRGTDANEIEIVDGDHTFGTREDLRRLQIPQLVTLLVYRSKFQLQAERREYFVYAPPDIKSAVKLATQLWNRWEKPPRLEEFLLTDMEDIYPKIDDACTSEVIDDAFFDEMWKAARLRKHRAAGHPEDPFAFTSLDPDVMVYKHTDFQKGLAVTV